MAKNVNPIIPGSPEAKTRSREHTQEFVDNLNRNVLKEGEEDSKKNKDFLISPKPISLKMKMSPWSMVAIIVVTLFLVLFSIDRVVLMKVEARCLEAGYTEAKVAWYINGYEGYCVGQGYAIPAPKFER
jgi:hypothetical protein